MAIIYSYPIVDPSANDLVLGSDVDSAGKATKNFTVQSIIDLVTVSGNDLQAVLDNGNTATNKDINITNNAFRGASFISVGGITLNGTTGSGFTSITSTDFTGTLQTAAQPNITSLGTLTSLKVGNNTPAITSLVTSFTAPGDNVKLATTKAIVDYVGTNPPGAESLAATLLVGNTTGATKIEVDNTGSGIDFIDDAKARFGTGNDLEIYHTGTESRISDVGTGSLVIQSSDIFLRTNGNENAVEAQANGTVKLFYDAAMKLSTTATGVSVTGNLGASGSGTFVNLINSGTYSDSSADVGSAGQILSSTGSGTNWINDPNPTPYDWVIEADSGAGSPYTVANGDTIDFVGVGNVDTAWDNASKELRISLSGTSISGTGTDTQVVYWTGAQTVSGDAGMVYNDTSNNLTVSGTVQAGTLSDGTFSGASGTYTGGVSITSTTFVGALTGNATSATQLASSGAIALTGDTTSTGGPHTYTSGGAVTIPTTIADTTVTAKVLTNLPTPTSSAIAATDTILAAMAKLQGQITGIPQGLVYKGTWNATTNTPTLASGTGTTGEFYIVSVAGSTNLDGITDWQVGDWAIFVEVGATDTWQKIDNTSAILGSGTANKIAKWTGSNTLATGLIEDDGTDVTVGNSGNLIVEGNTTLGNADSDTTTVKGPAHFEEQLRVDEGISLGNNTYGSAGQVLTSGGGSSSVNTWTTPTTGTVTSVTAGTGITIGGTAADPTVSIDVVGTDNAVEVLTAATPASGDFIWFSDINDSNTLRKCTLADIQNPVGGPFLPLAGGTMTGNTLHGDGVKSMYGAGNDLQIDHDGTNSAINNITGNFIIQQSVDDQDLVFKCDDGSGGVTEYFRLDGSSVFNIFSKQVYLPDNVKATFGDGSDLQIYHDATDSYISNTEGDLIIQNDHNDKDIFFKCDSGAGGLVSYFFLDGSDVNTRFAKDYKVSDSIKGLYGSDGDLEIFHDGSNSFISEVGTGDLTISTNGTSIFLKTNSTESSADFITNGAVKLYYDNSLTFETTTSGVSVTGDISLTGDINIGAGKKLIYNSNSFITPENNTSGAEVSTAGTFTVKTGGTPTLGLTVKADQVIQISDYGSGTNTGTPTFNLEVDSAGNIIETPSLNPGGKGGVYTGNKSFTGGAAAATLFRLTRGTTGALVFDVYLTSGTSQYSVKKYTVAHILNTVPTYNKIIDSGFTTNGDYTVAFVNDGQGVGGDTVKCTIAATTSQDIYYTVVVGHGATAVTRHTS